MTRIDVTTGSRLHFGLICGTQQSGWEFGGIGMMVRKPSWKIRLTNEPGERDQISAGAEATERVQDFLRQIRSTRTLAAVNVTITEEVPFHTGLGGGTQLGLALAASTELLSGVRPSHDPYELAQIAQRAERSAVGTVGFRDGGFLIDHGLPGSTTAARRVERLATPEAWRFVLVRPAQAQGLCGDEERRFFNKRVHMPANLVAELGRQIEQDLVQSIQDVQFDQFAASLESFGRAVGAFYASEQGDVFAHPVIRRLVTDLQRQGIQGTAQSSWGPGICVPARSMEHAMMIEREIPAAIDQTGLAVTIAEPLNVGATIRSTGYEDHSRGHMA